MTLLEPYPHERLRALRRGQPALAGRSADGGLRGLLTGTGRPIGYGYLDRR